MSEGGHKSREWTPWAIAIGIIVVGVLMCLFGRKGAMSDRPNFYLSADGVSFALSPFVTLAGAVRLAFLCVRAVRGN